MLYLIYFKLHIFFLISCHHFLSSLPSLSFLHPSCLSPYLSSSCHPHHLHRQALDPEDI